MTLKDKRCLRKVPHRTLEQAEKVVTELLEQRIYDIYQPRAFRCGYGNHYHVGHSLKIGIVVNT